MGTPGDRGDGEERQGGWQSEWQSGGWQSQWQQPGGEQGRRQDQPAQPQQPGAQWMPSAPAASGRATASLVLGLVGLVVCPLVCSVLALVFGYQGRREIDSSGGQLSGRGLAIAGIVLGWIGVVFYGLIVLLIIIGALAGDSASATSATGVPA